MKLLDRIRNLWQWSEMAPREFFQPTAETIERWRKITAPFEVKGDGKAEFLPLMSEDEMLAYIKETEHGWGKIFNTIRNLGKPDEPSE